MTVTLPSPDSLQEIIETRGLQLTVVTFAAYVTVSAAVSYLAGGSAPDTRGWVTNLGLVSGLVNAGMALLVYPWLFAFISRRLGQPSGAYEVRSCTALSLWPWMLGALLGTLGHALLLGMVFSVLSAITFIYALSLTLRETPGRTAVHSVMVWLLMIAGLFVVSGIVSFLLSLR